MLTSGSLVNVQKSCSSDGGTQGHVIALLCRHKHQHEFETYACLQQQFAAGIVLSIYTLVPVQCWDIHSIPHKLYTTTLPHTWLNVSCPRTTLQYMIELCVQHTCTRGSLNGASLVIPCSSMHWLSHVFLEQSQPKKSQATNMQSEVRVHECLCYGSKGCAAHQV